MIAVKQQALISTPLALGILAFAFLAGYHYRTSQIRKSEPKFITIERYVEIPGKKDKAVGAPIRPNAERINLQDSLIALAFQNDTLAQFAETLSTPFEAVFEDTISVTDSLGSFRTRRIDSLRIDPLTRLIDRRVAYLESKLTTVKIEQLVTLEEGWFDRVLWWLERATLIVLGVLLGAKL